MNYYLFGQRSKVCGPSKVNIFNQLGETSDLFLARQCWWVESDLSSKVYVLYHSTDGDLFLRSHSERTHLLQYMFQITVIIITFSYKKYIFVN